MSAAACWLVKLKFGRVQTYLFEEPQLKSMVGANSLLGETARGRLVRAAKDDTGYAFTPQAAKPLDDREGGGAAAGRHTECAGYTGGARPEAADAAIDNLPGLAVACGAGLPEGLTFSSEDFQAAQLGKPGDGDLDDPWRALQHGVLIRDAGTLHALFPDSDHAADFVAAAETLVAEQLPGIRLEVETVELEQQNGVWRIKPSQRTPIASPGETPVDLPPLQVCQASGQGPASRLETNQDSGVKEKECVSEQVYRKRAKTGEFDQGQTYDLLGLLRHELLKRFMDRLGTRRRIVFPRNFEEVAPSGYLAVIVADGNGMGSRSREYVKRCVPGGEDGDFFRQHVAGERLFASMRAAVREALLSALADTFAVPGLYPEGKRRDAATERDVRVPFRLLMLGGDDLLMVCDAVRAMPLVIHYARRLTEFLLAAAPAADGRPAEAGRPLDVGVGVAITKRSFPFHRSHALAEQLAGSAKRLARESGLQRSVVDWLSTTESWHGDVRKVRQRDALRSYTLPAHGEVEHLILSRKPYPILDCAERDSLESLWNVAALVHGQKTPRNQWKQLALPLEEGRRVAERVASDVLADIPEQVTQRLVRARLFRRLTDRPGYAWSPWQEGVVLPEAGPKPALRQTAWSTAYVDFLELYDLCCTAREKDDVCKS